MGNSKVKSSADALARVFLALALAFAMMPVSAWAQGDGRDASLRVEPEADRADASQEEPAVDRSAGGSQASVADEAGEEGGAGGAGADEAVVVAGAGEDAVSASDAPEDGLGGDADAGVAEEAAGANALEIVKRGAPVGAANAHDEFPITVELENSAGASLERVVVSDDDFLAASAANPHLDAGAAVASMPNIVESAASLCASVAALPDGSSAGAGAAAIDEALVALIDTGAPDMPNVVGHYSVIGEEVGDDNGHGTEMLDAIVCENPDARVVSIKALDRDGCGSAAGVYAAIQLAIAKGAGVVNLSFAARDTLANAAIAQGVANALAAGAVVVAAAGNGGYDAKYFTPANVRGAVTVGAATASGEVRSISNKGACVDLFVEADSTSEAAAKVSGWLSANPGDARPADCSEIPISVDVGDGACRFEAASGLTAVQLVFDTVMAMAEKCNATGYMTLKLGTLGACKISVTGVGKGDSKNYYKKTQTLKWSLSNTTGSYFKANSTTVKTTNQLRCLNQTATYYRYVTFPLTVKVPAGYHSLNATRDDSNGGACSTYNNTSADHTEKSWERTASNGGGNQSASDAERTVYVTINLTQTGLLYTTDKAAYHAVYKLNLTGNNYTVAYNANGGTGAPAATSHVYTTASKLSSTKPTRANYTFTGWNTAANGKGTAYAAGQSVSTLAKAGTVTLYAQWKENPKYTVTYNGNGGTPARASDTVYTGAKVTLPGATRSGYTFKGWSTSKTAASGTTGSYTVTAAATLYATWQENNRTVAYNGNGGVPSRTSDSVTPGSSVSLPTVKSYPSGHNQNTGSACTVSYDARGGEVGALGEANTKAAQYLVYGFNGWYTAASGGTRVGAQSASYTPPFGATSLYMQWSRNYLYRAVSLPTPVREGYDFKGWATAPGASSGATGSYTPSGNVTLYALWSEQAYTVRFDANGAQGSMPAQTAYADHDWEVPEAAFHQEGYHASWNTAADGGGTPYTPGMRIRVRENVTLFAQWSENTKRTVVVHPAAGQSVLLSGIPDNTAYRVTDGEQPARWRLISQSPQSGVLAGNETKTVVSESAYELCTVTFRGNGATGFMEPEKAFAGDAVAVPESTFEYDGHHFIEWNTSADGGGSSFSPGEELPVGDDVELYAQWVTQAEWEAGRQVTVSYSAGAGSGHMPAQTVIAGTSVTVPGCAFTRVGYSFKCWNTASDGSGRTYEPGDEVIVQRDAALTAQWEILQLSFSVPAKLGYAVKANGDLVAVSGEAARITSFIDVGMSVVGVKAEAASGYVLTSNPLAPGDVDYAFTPAGSPRFAASGAVGGFADVEWRVPGKGSLKLSDFGGKVARWDEGDTAPREIGSIVWKLAIRDVAVTFDPNGADGEVMCQRANAEEEFCAPGCGYEHPEGPRFLCWNTAPDGSGSSFAPGQPMSFADDTTLYALWETP